jgi:hypothetical protein
MKQTNKTATSNIDSRVKSNVMYLSKVITLFHLNEISKMDLKYMIITLSNKRRNEKI